MRSISSPNCFRAFIWSRTPARAAGPFLESCFATSRPTVPVAPVTKTVSAISFGYIGKLCRTRIVSPNKTEIEREALKRAHVYLSVLCNTQRYVHSERAEESRLYICFAHENRSSVLCFPARRETPKSGYRKIILRLFSTTGWRLDRIRNANPPASGHKYR